MVTYECDIHLEIEAKNEAEALRIARRGNMSETEIHSCEDGNFGSLLYVDENSLEEVTKFSNE